MKLLFVHSTKFKMDTQGQLYTDGSYTKDVWDRYLSISDNLSVIARKDTNVYDAKYANDNFNYFDKTKIRFIEVPNLTSSYSSFFNFKKRYNIEKLIKEVVIEHDYIIARIPSSVGNLAIKYARRYKKPYLVELVGCPWDVFWNHSIKGKLMAPFMYFTTKKNVREAEYVVYVTNEFLQRRYPCKGRNIACSNVLLEPLDKGILERRIKRIEKMVESKPIILGTTAAVNVRYKGQEYVIKAISHLNQEGYNFEYHLVGGGDNSFLKSVARKYNVSDKVKFLGSLSHKEVFNFLDNIDIYIQPSLTEGLPRALIEAMSRGVPAVGSSAGGIPELLEDRYIINNRGRNVDEICSILKSFNKEAMIMQAKRNFEEAKKYNKKIIDKRRQEFLIEFTKS